MYNYYEALKEDVKDFVENNAEYFDWSDIEDKDELEQTLYDALWIEDSVTGNGSGSYTFNSNEAFDNLRGNLDLLAEACEEFGADMDVLKSGAEACDVTIRCYLLGNTIYELIDELYDIIHN